MKQLNIALNSESAHFGDSTFSNLSTIASSVYVLCAQFRLAQRNTVYSERYQMVSILRSLMVTAALVLATYGANAVSADNNWLIGKWELAHDPDGSKKDWVEFTVDGNAFSIYGNGRRVPGKYSVSGQAINIVYTFKGKTIPISITHSSDKTKLLVYSKQTGNTSEYRKVNN